MAAVALIALPYDSGRFEERMGCGPGVLMAGGLIDALRAQNFEVNTSSIRLPAAFHTEASALVDLQRSAVLAIREARARGDRPIVLSGNCGPAALSAVAALGGMTTGVIWFDAHGDFNTPETSASGFLDGMGLAILMGQCWSNLVQRFESFTPVPAEHVVQVGVHDVEEEEGARLAESSMVRIHPGRLDALDAAIRALSTRVSQVYVHVDVDVLDLAEGAANSYACAGGVRLADLREALKTIGKVIPIAAGSITSYDPKADSDGRIGRAIPHIVELLVR